MNIIEITDSGIATTNRDTIFNNLMQEFKNLYGANAYIKEGTEDYNMISLLADLLSDMGNAAISASNALSLTNAVGVQLDNLASIYYGTFSRKPATYSTVDVTLTGISGTRIINGQVRDSYGGIWNLETPITIPNAGSYTAKATYTEPGAYFISANQIEGASAIATPVAGWESVEQPNECYVGQNIETDASFRARIAKRSSANAIGTLNTLQSNLLSLEFVDTTPIQDVKIYENDTSLSEEVVSGLTLPAHSICAIILSDTPFTDTDGDGKKLGTYVAETLYNYKSTGVGTYGSITENITNSLGQTIPINFTSAVNQTFEVTVNLRKLVATAPELTDSAINAIRNAVNTQMQSYNIGDTVYAQDFYYPVTLTISQVLDIAQYNINSITLTSGLDVDVDTVVLSYNAKAIISNLSTDITVNLS